MATGMAVDRGCGRRVKGGVYAEVPLGPFGVPVEHFLIEPPTLVDQDALGVTPIGVSLVSRDDVWHVVDWVGEGYYPNVADMVEEIREMGLSRRLPKSLDYSKLTRESRIILLHARAHINNWTDYENAVDFRCPKQSLYRDKPHPDGMCIAAWWSDLEDGKPVGEPAGTARRDGGWLIHQPVRRQMPSFSYYGYAPPQGVEPARRLAAFASFPISRLAVINDPEGRTHEDAVKAARHSGLPVALEEV